jgi:hypothetical protein
MYFAFLGHVSNELERIFPGDQRQMMLGQYHLVDSVVDELSTVFLADLPDLVTWRGQKNKYVCLRSPDRPYFSAADPNLFHRQLFDPIFASDPINFYTEFV